MFSLVRQHFVYLHLSHFLKKMKFMLICMSHLFRFLFLVRWDIMGPTLFCCVFCCMQPDVGCNLCGLFIYLVFDLFIFMFPIQPFSTRMMSLDEITSAEKDDGSIRGWQSIVVFDLALFAFDTFYTPGWFWNVSDGCVPLFSSPLLRCDIALKGCRIFLYGGVYFLARERSFGSYKKTTFCQYFGWILNASHFRFAHFFISSVTISFVLLKKSTQSVL